MANQEQYVRDQEIDPALFTPKDQIRQWAHPLPPQFPLDPAVTLGLKPAPGPGKVEK
jgi:ribonuclease Z